MEKRKCFHKIIESTGNRNKKLFRQTFENELRKYFPRIKDLNHLFWKLHETHTTKKILLKWHEGIFPAAPAQRKFNMGTLYKIFIIRLAPP